MIIVLVMLKFLLKEKKTKNMIEFTVAWLHNTFSANLLFEYYMSTLKQYSQTVAGTESGLFGVFTVFSVVDLCTVCHQKNVIFDQ
jgi:hypothetical protein